MEVLLMIKIQECSMCDISVLARMNKCLIEDEKAENTMDILQLEKRMEDFLNTGYKAFFFLSNNEIIGYALCNMNQYPIYLRQFFIKREERRKSYGKQAFNELIQYINVSELDIDVYVWNKAGVAFWESLGFEKRCFNMRYKNRN